jgi:hypothetical protein
MFRRTFLPCLLLVVLAACAPAVALTPLPTVTLDLPTLTPSGTATLTLEEPSPTEPPPDPSPTLTPEPVQTDTPAPLLPTLARATVSPTNAPFVAAQSAAIQFYAPGPMSRVTSPVLFYGYAVPGGKHKGLAELYGEDGRVLASEIMQLNTDYKWAYFAWRLDFEVRGAGELGRLSLSTRDEYGRLTALQSVHLLLLPEGPEIINPSESLAERCVVDFPVPGKRITGGTLSVTGNVQPYNSLPLIVELITTEGTSVGSQLITVSPGQEGKVTLFQVDVPYNVTKYTPVLLTVRQPDDRIQGTMYLYSQEIFLSP